MMTEPDFSPMRTVEQWEIMDTTWKILGNSDSLYRKCFSPWGWSSIGISWQKRHGICVLGDCWKLSKMLLEYIGKDLEAIRE